MVRSTRPAQKQIEEKMYDAALLAHLHAKKRELEAEYVEALGYHLGVMLDDNLSEFERYLAAKASFELNLAEDKEYKNICRSIAKVKSYLLMVSRNGKELDIDSAKSHRIEEILSTFGYNVIKGQYCLCPFHKEDTPSFSIKRNGNTWKCFGCGESGDSISLQMKLGNMSFVEAVKELT